MPINTYVKSGGTFNRVKSISVKQSGVWRVIKNAYVKQGGVWRNVFSFNRTLTGVQSAAGCYSAQGGFSVDVIDGVTTLSLGAWPSDPPNCQTANWQWLQLAGKGANGLSNDSTSNIYRTANNIRPYWTKTNTVNIDNIAVGSSVNIRFESWPYTLVSYTYRIVKTSANSIGIIPYPTPWGTGDAGTSISIDNWWRNVATLGGGGVTSVQTGVDAEGGPIYSDEYNPGQINLSWTA